MTTVSTDEIAHLRRSGQHARAWSRLLHGFRFATDFHSSSHAMQLWLDHAVGRYGDNPSSQDKRHRQEPGFLLWPYFQERWRECLAQPTLEDQVGSLQQVSEELCQAEQVWLHTIERIDAYLDSTRQQVRSLLSGHFAICQTLLAAAPCVLDPTAPNHRFQKAVATSLGHYYQARCSQSLASQDVLCRKIRLPPSEQPFVTLNLLEVFPKQLQSVWSLARREAQAIDGFSLALDQAVGMAQQATRWLLDQPRSAATPATVWRTLLLLEGPATSCAWLQLQAMPDDFGSLRAYPDPIHMGLLGFDARWQESMEDALRAVSGTVHEDQPKAWCWSLRYADRQLARLLTRSRPELEDFVQRPLQQAGSSASASLAVMLYRATRGLPWNETVGLSAAVTDQGQLMPVRLSEKLQDSPLWQKYSSQRLNLLLVAPEPNQEIQRWHECLAASAHRRLELDTCDTVEEASRFISQWQQRQGRRRLFLRCGMAFSLAPLMAVPWIWPQIYRPKRSPANVRFVITLYDRARQEVSQLSADHLPLHPGDEIRLEATADEPLYFYLFWINVDGTADPLWPWDRDWQKLDPQRDQPLSRLTLPDPAGYWELTPDREGMQSIVLVASPTRLRLSEWQLRRLFYPVEQSARLRPLDRDRLIYFKNHQILRANDLSPVAHAARREAKDLISVTQRGVEDLFRRPNTEVQALCFPFENISR